MKARELAEAAALTKAQFLATVSHEIRTPLNGIIGTTELLAGTRLTPQQRDYVETARRSGEVLLSVLNDILDFSKVDAGRLELETIEFDLRTCVEGVGDILAPKAREKGLELAVRTETLAPGRVLGDPARLRQVLLNLGGNAVKFTNKGEVVILAEPDRGRPGQGFVVSDVPFAPLSEIAALRRGRNGSRSPLKRLASVVRYRALTDEVHIGFINPGRGAPLSGSWRRIAQEQQAGFWHGMDDATRAALLRQLKFATDPQQARFLHLRKTTRRFHTPARPIIEPFWRAHQAEALRNIRANFRRKIAGERI